MKNMKSSSIGTIRQSDLLELFPKTILTETMVQEIKGGRGPGIDPYG